MALFPVTMRLWILVAIFTMALMVQDAQTAAQPFGVSDAGADSKCPHVGPPG